MLGFSEAHAKKALKNTGGNAERAADWLFAHADELDAMGDDDGGAAGGDGGEKKMDDGPGKYNLLGFVSHVGRNTGSGHYVAHIKKNGEWVIFDDEKVAKSQNPPFDYGYLYCFKRE
jgi:ubiquitin carboxyl-terminal hydrolase 5/13